MKVKIQDLKPGVVSGTEVQLPGEVTPYQEAYFNWYPSNLITTFKTVDVSGGMLITHPHKIEYKKVEHHIDSEIFYFVSGDAVMFFCDLKDGEADMSTAQLVRIKEGTQLKIFTGKAHFAPIALGDGPLKVVVVCPKLESPIVMLSETVEPE